MVRMNLRSTLDKRLVTGEINIQEHKDLVDRLAPGRRLYLSFLINACIIILYFTLCVALLNGDPANKYTNPGDRASQSIGLAAGYLLGGAIISAIICYFAPSLRGWRIPLGASLALLVGFATISARPDKQADISDVMNNSKIGEIENDHLRRAGEKLKVVHPALDVTAINQPFPINVSLSEVQARRAAFQAAAEAYDDLGNNLKERIAETLKSERPYLIKDLTNMGVAESKTLSVTDAIDEGAIRHFSKQNPYHLVAKKLYLSRDMMDLLISTYGTWQSSEGEFIFQEQGVIDKFSAILAKQGEIDKDIKAILK